MEDILPGGDGLYAVCCLNINLKDVPSIHKDFGKHGKIVSVRQANKENGWIFIRFHTAEEAKSVLEDNLLNKDYPKLRMANPSTKQTENHTFSDGRKGYSKKFDEKENSNIKHPMKHNNQGKNAGPVHYSRESKNGISECDVSPQNLKTDGSASNGQHLYKKESKTSAIDRLCSERDRRNNVNQQRQNKQEKLEEYDLAPPPLEDLSIGDDSEEYSKPVNVVIANIPPGMKRIDIYHLLSFLEPIYISPFQVTGVRYNLKYCHVYLHNVDDAITAELEFNGLPCDGRHLIVKQYEKFFQEAS